MSQVVDQIKDRLSIVDIVSEYVQLQSAGGHLRAKSPFTSEKTPSFFVSPEKGLFFCFSSGKGGDMFTFIQEIEGISFSEALKLLAGKAGVELKPENKALRTEREQMISALDTASLWYQVQLRKDKPSVDYLLEQRGLTKDTIKKFRVGYAPGGGWSLLCDVLRKRNFSKQVLEKVGLVIQGKNNLFDRFRNRIMFPIMDHQSRVVGFSGRIFLPDDPESAKTQAKYMNSPEGGLYHKSKVLYGYNLARNAIMKSGIAVLVEGQMDVVMSHQAGVENVVALSGTALSVEQLGLIKRFSKHLIIALDADRAGMVATQKSVMLAYQNEMTVSVAELPEGSDPADLVKEDPVKWQEAIARAVDFVDYRIKHIKNSSTHDKQQAVRAELYPYVRALSGTLEKDDALRRISALVGSRIEIVHADFRHWRSKQALKQPVLDNEAISSFSEYSLPPRDRLFGILFTEESKEDPRLNPDTLRLTLEKTFSAEYSTLLEDMKMRQPELIFRCEVLYEHCDAETLERETSQLLSYETLQQAEKQFNMVQQQLRQAEADQAHDVLNDLLHTTKKLSEHIASLKASLHN